MLIDEHRKVWSLCQVPKIIVINTTIKVDHLPVEVIYFKKALLWI